RRLLLFLFVLFVISDAGVVLVFVGVVVEIGERGAFDPRLDPAFQSGLDPVACRHRGLAARQRRPVAGDQADCAGLEAEQRMNQQAEGDRGLAFVFVLFVLRAPAFVVALGDLVGGRIAIAEAGR